MPFATPVPSTLSATSSTLTVHEGLYAVASYSFDRALPGPARFAVSLTGWDAALGTDTGVLSLSTDGGAHWADLSSGAAFTLDSGCTGFQVRTLVNSDSLVESTERFVFTASQTEYSPFVSNSWWVQTLVEIADGPLGAPPLPEAAPQATLTAAQALVTASEGQAAQASFQLSAPLARDAQVHVTVVGWGAHAGVDFQGFDYRMAGASSWAAVPADGLVTLHAGAPGFELRTQLLSDLSSPEVGESVVFVASQTGVGQGLQDSWWVQSQVQIQDVAPTPTPAGGRWVLPGFDINHGWELWTSDGTDAGATRLLDILPGTSGAAVSQLTALGSGLAVFSANDGGHGQELWVTDGSADGSHQLLDLWPGVVAGDPKFITALGSGRAIFQAVDPVHGYELWVTNGTAAGTQVLKDINPGAASGGAWGITALGNGQAILCADDGVHGAELWVSDGTAAGTRLLLDIHAGAGASNLFFPTALGNGKVVFNSYDPTRGFELWVTDGTVAGTQLVKDILPGAPSGNPFYITALGGGKAVFMANDAVYGQELWVTDGSAAGTVLLKDIVAGAGPSSPSDITPLGNGLAVFRAEDGVHGRELWVTDGTAAGTRMVKDIVTGATSTDPISFTALGHGQASFYCDDGIGRPMLYITDGSEAGTHRLHDFGILTGMSYRDYLNWAQAAQLDATSPVPGADAARLSATQSTLAVVEGAQAIARFELSAPLAADAQVDVYLHGWSAQVGVDTTGFDYSSNGSTWATVPASARVTIPAGATGLWLRTTTTADNLSESTESLVFVVQQASSNLHDSWWLNTTVTLADPAPHTITGGAGADLLLGTAAQDVFVIPSGSSVGRVGQFDTLMGLSLGDRIDLPTGVNPYNLGTLTPDTPDEAGLLTAWSFINGWTFPGGPGAVLKIVLGPDAYLSADTNANGLVDAGSDLFIKVVGGAGLVSADLM